MHTETLVAKRDGTRRAQEYNEKRDANARVTFINTKIHLRRRWIQKQRTKKKSQDGLKILNMRNNIDSQKIL